MGDKYDDAIAYLKANPEQIYDAWLSHTRHPAGVLFKRAASTNTIEFGCLTQIRDGCMEAEIDDLTTRIRADKRIPENASEITVGNLHVFAEWQRIIDKELGGI